VVGYDLTGLVCGSEGTLAIVTEATVRLRPPPPAVCTLAASFGELEAAGRAVARIARETAPSLLELMDRATVAAVERFKPMELDEDAVLVFARSDAGPVDGRSEVARIEAICAEEGAALVATSDDPAEGEMLLAARRLAYPALERLGATLLDDVCV